MGGVGSNKNTWEFSTVKSQLKRTNFSGIKCLSMIKPCHYVVEFQHMWWLARLRRRIDEAMGYIKWKPSVCLLEVQLKLSAHPSEQKEDEAIMKIECSKRQLHSLPFTINEHIALLTTFNVFSKCALTINHIWHSLRFGCWVIIWKLIGHAKNIWQNRQINEVRQCSNVIEKCLNTSIQNERVAISTARHTTSTNHRKEISKGDETNCSLWKAPTVYRMSNTRAHTHKSWASIWSWSLILCCYNSLHPSGKAFH